LSTTNLTWADLRWKPGLHGDRPTTNRLGHGTAFENYVTVLFYAVILDFFLKNIASPVCSSGMSSIYRKMIKE
jgi:hypothetical protein